MSLFGGEASTAVISDDGRYRYDLTRTWDSSLEKVLWIMLNPSTADANVNDWTIGRCIAFGRAWGFGGIRVANLFALRATDPKELRRAEDPVGPENDLRLLRSVERATLIIAAWGAHGSYLDRDRKVMQLLANRDVRCLGRTAAGAPRHPRGIPGNIVLEEYR